MNIKNIFALLCLGILFTGCGGGEKTEISINITTPYAVESMADEPPVDESPPVDDETLIFAPENMEDVPEYIYDQDSLLGAPPITEGEIEITPQEQEINFILQQQM